VFRVWCDVYGHEVLVPGYQVHGVERHRDGDIVTFRCVCGRDATSEPTGRKTAVHRAPAERLPIAV
jgi:hypothetical protein